MADENADSHDGSNTDESSGGPTPRRLSWPMMLIAVAASVGLSYVLVNHFFGYFGVSKDLEERTAAVTSINLPPDLEAEYRRAELHLRYQNSALLYGMAGACVAALLALAAGMSSKSLGRGLAGLAGGLVVGALLGGFGGAMAQGIDEGMHVRDNMNGYFPIVLMHVAGWSFVALAACFAVQIARPTPGFLALLSTTLAVVLVANALIPIAAAFVSIDRINLPIPAGDSNRLLWLGLNQLAIGFGMVKAN